MAHPSKTALNFAQTFTSPTIFESWGSTILSFFRYPFRHSNTEQAKVLWLVNLRWLAITSFATFGSVGYALKLIEPYRLPAYIGILGIVVVFNLLTQVYFSARTENVAQVTLCFQMAFDLVVLTIMLYLTRGVENPFIGLYLLHACLGGLLIPGYLTLPYILLTHVSVVFLQLDYISDIPGSPTSRVSILWMVVLHVLILGFWIVMRSLGYYLEKQSENQLKLRILSETQDRLRAVGSLAAGFSHEFASPLNTAKVRLDRAFRKTPTEDIAEALEAIQTCETILHQMNDSQLDARSFVQKPVSLHELLLDVIQSWREENPDSKLEVQAKNVGIHGVPPINFAQVVLNLLDNAYRENKMGRILVLLDSRPEEILLSVQDEGPGFPDLILKRIGEPFLTTKPDGTGLGLYVSNLFAQSLGGSLEIKSAPQGKGSVVTLMWPTREVHP